jgi:ferric-dicitrate binding protein FerR (iron transport regulator)
MSDQQNPLFEQLLRLLEGSLSREEESRINELLRKDPDARALLRQVAEHAVTVADAERIRQGRQEELANLHRWTGESGKADAEGEPESSWNRKVFHSWKLAASLILGLVCIGFLILNLLPSESSIALLREMGGAVEWTGEGGQIITDLASGTRLSGGGSLESLSVDSWATLEFSDGSEVTISGQSLLTIFLGPQKILYLRQGSLSAHVSRQPTGHPMILRTPTARLEVLGTQLNVEAESASTRVNVTEGRVRVIRLADGSEVEVPGGHQVVASADRNQSLQVAPRPAPVIDWRSDLPQDGSYGEWIPGKEGLAGSMRNSPLLWNAQDSPITLHLVGILVSKGQRSPVLLVPGARLRIHGRIETPGTVYFGITTKHLRGGFSGKFLVARHFDARDTGRIGLELALDEFAPQEPRLIEKAPGRFPASPSGLELVDWWCCTINEDSGLNISSIELIPPK